MKMETLVRMAIEEAQKSEFKLRLGCVIFDKKNIVSLGHNYKEKSISSYTKEFIGWKNSIHAEVDAIISAKTDLKGMSLLVVRINRRKQLLMAKPCKYCMSYIKRVGIRDIYYSTDGYPPIIHVNQKHFELGVEV